MTTHFFLTCIRMQLLSFYIISKKCLPTTVELFKDGRVRVATLVCVPSWFAIVVIVAQCYLRLDPLSSRVKKRGSSLLQSFVVWMPSPFSPIFANRTLSSPLNPSWEAGLPDGGYFVAILAINSMYSWIL